MHRPPHSPNRLAVVRALILFLGMLTGSAVCLTDSSWVAPNPGISGANGDVTAVVVAPNGELYVGGNFTAIGDVAANHIARWDGRHWSALGSGVYGTAAVVNALAVDSSGNVYVGGTFKSVGGFQTGSIARWDGKSWSAMGDGLHGSVFSLVLGDSGSVYAGGLFQFSETWSPTGDNRVAHWNGASWSPLGIAPSGTVHAMLRDRTGILLACGDRPSRWTGSVWEVLGTGHSGCETITQAGDGTIYIGGSFEDGAIGANASWGVSRWSGTDWFPMRDAPKQFVSSLVVDSSGTLYATCICDSAGGKPAQGLVKWDGKVWGDVGGSLSKGTGRALAIDKSGALVVGGAFMAAGDLGARGLARWDRTRWTTYGQGINGAIYAVAWDDKGRLFVGGEFTAAGNVRGNGIAMWDGRTWSALGSGLGKIGRATKAVVRSLVVDSSGNVYVGGNFDSAGDVQAKDVAKWNGSAWSSLGPYSASASATNDEVDALLIDGNGRLYAGGDFGSLGGVDALNVALWNGASWKPLGKGLVGQVKALLLDDQGRLVAGGRGESVNNSYHNTVARFDDTGWTSLSISSDNRVTALGLRNDGQILAGGDFSWIGGRSAYGLATWNGAAWDTVPGNPSMRTASIATHGDGSFLVGAVHSDGYRNLHEWKADAWSAWLPDPDGTVASMAFDKSGNLAVAGEFATLRRSQLPEDNLYSPYLALRRTTESPVAVVRRHLAANHFEGRPVHIDVSGIDGRRRPSIDLASWSRSLEGTKLRSLGSGTWLVRRSVSGSPTEAGIVIVP